MVVRCNLFVGGQQRNEISECPRGALGMALKDYTCSDNEVVRSRGQDLIPTLILFVFKLFVLFGYDLFWGFVLCFFSSVALAAWLRRFVLCCCLPVVFVQYQLPCRFVLVCPWFAR